ncbi:ubiquitin-conjugating enzyme E2-binding protein [Fimicolochytrium jonesii]|uniref:ubiquitin-conjugating enzyme E2-binding protein n=1 Tax=Fimicolochytrium jonesii TaxID=1396493 RepID=UPI0022FDC8ED|nr:ubiquitin-conjugating enzyme E2-binding protein [Fimicolochytrium jonesii]KAI8826259.1 ubiquitin-conjugating enzyme E2-binding protein [Fimicolochytrium jonesii]
MTEEDGTTSGHEPNPGSPIPYFLEVLLKLRSLAVSLRGVSDVTAGPKHLAATFQSARHTPIEIPLPLEVDPASLKKIRHDSGVDAQLTLRYAARIPETPKERLMDVEPLRGLSQVECHQCHNPLLLPGSGESNDSSASGPRFSRAVEMPSEYWHELTDCWACHKEDYSQMPGQKGGVVLAVKGTLLVAKSYVVLHPDDVDLTTAVRVEIGEREKGILRVGRTAPAYCTHCSHDIGEVQLDQIPDAGTDIRPYIHGVKLYKYWTDLVVPSPALKDVVGKRGSEGEQRIHAHFATYFVEEVLESTGAHAAFRFAVYEKGGERPRILLWVLNPDVLITTTIHPSTDDITSVLAAASQETIEAASAVIVERLAREPRGFVPALKVMYMDCRAETAAITSTMTQWASDPQVEPITLHATLCEEVLASLKLSSGYGGGKKMGGFEVGFLCRG